MNNSIVIFNEILLYNLAVIVYFLALWLTYIPFQVNDLNCERIM